MGGDERSYPWEASRPPYRFRSRFFAKAAEDFIRRYRGRTLLQNYNDVYADGLTDEDAEFLGHAKAAAAKFLEREEW